MTYKSILVHIDGHADCPRRVAAAARLAAELRAHVTGLAIVPPLELPQALRSHAGAKAILNEEWAKSRAAARAFADDFVKGALAAGAPSADAMVAEDEPIVALEKAARACDLVVMGQPDADDLGAFGGHFVEAAVIAVSRPMLLVHAAGEAGPIGERVLVAWKDAAASARALADARPLLERARAITVLTVEEDGKTGDARDALAFLSRHGLKGEALNVRADDAGTAIVAEAARVRADLIVMGAFARPRLSEMVLGGATRSVLQNMASNVLMSH